MTKIVNWLKTNTGEIIRLFVLLLALVNQWLAMNGKSPLPITNDDINYWVSTGITGVISIYTFFVDNHFDLGGGDQSETQKQNS